MKAFHVDRRWREDVGTAKNLGEYLGELDGEASLYDDERQLLTRDKFQRQV